MRILVSLIIYLFFTVNAHASLELGLSALVPTSTVDHLKYGPHLGLKLFQNSAWKLEAELDAMFTTVNAVNPGAVSNSTAPDQKESTNGAFVFLGKVYLVSPYRLLDSELSFGSLSFFPDFTTRSIGIPWSIGTRLRKLLVGDKQSKSLCDLSVFMGFNPLTDQAIYVGSQLRFIFKMGESFKIVPEVQWLFAKNFKGFQTSQFMPGFYLELF